MGTGSDADLQQTVTAYQRDGYVACEGLLSDTEVGALQDEAAAIASGRRGAIVGADDRGGLSDEAVIGRVLAIHHPHKRSALVRATMAHPALTPILQALIGANVKAMQTMLFIKRAGKPGQAWHQDEHYIATRDRSLCGAWIALDDATVENGCLWIHPGSHRSGILHPTRAHGDARFDGAEEAYGHPYAREGGAPVELKAGGVAFFNGYVLHRSLPNRAASGFRRALVTHYMNAHSLLPWAGSHDFRDIVMVAGEDPYAWRGLQDASIPYIRPDNVQKTQAVYAELARLERARRGGPA